MSKNRDRISGVDTNNMAGIYDIMAETMPPDQIYRELITNSLESGARMRERDPNFKGTIFIGESTHHPGKLCVMDNCEGIPRNKILPLTGDLAATYKQSEAGNFGHGTKAAAFANNKYGILYHSLFVDDKGKGSGVRMYYNGKDYAHKYYEEFNDHIVPMDREDFPELIQKAGHGNITTLMGNSEEENTLSSPSRYDESSLLRSGRKSPIYWLMAFVNTKFFEIPDYMKIIVETRRKDGSRVDRETVHGHKNILNKYSHAKDRGVIDFIRAKIHWWLMSDDFGKRSSVVSAIPSGQLSILHQKEIYKISYEDRPLRSWGLPFSGKMVALVVEFKNLQPVLQRTTLYLNKKEYTDYISGLRELFKKNTPTVLVKNEERMQQEHSKRLLSNEGLEKQISRYLKSYFGLEDKNGTEMIGEILSQRGRKKRIPGPPGPKPEPRHPIPLPGPHFGPDPTLIGLKNLEGKKKAIKAYPNSMPKFQLRDDDDASNIEYDYDDNICYLSSQCRLFNEYAEMAHEKLPNFQFDTIKGHTIKAIQDLLGTRIAITKGRRLLTEQRKRDLLKNEDALLMTILSPFEVIDRVLKSVKLVEKEFDKEDHQKSLKNGSTAIHA